MLEDMCFLCGRRCETVDTLFFWKITDLDDRSAGIPCKQVHNLENFARPLFVFVIVRIVGASLCCSLFQVQCFVVFVD